MKMASKLPDGDSNGLGSLTRKLVEDPTGLVVCVAVIDASQILLDVDKGTRQPTVRIQHIEPMLDEEDRRSATRLLTGAYQARTSEQLELPGLDEFLRVGTGVLAR
jgi:hypothetical protein